MADQSATNLRLDQAVSTTTTGWWLTYPEKYEFVNGKDDTPYKKWKIKFMFETTNQNFIKSPQSSFPGQIMEV
jgi:hypothetical protein